MSGRRPVSFAWLLTQVFSILIFFFGAIVLTNPQKLELWLREAAEPENIIPFILVVALFALVYATLLLWIPSAKGPDRPVSANSAEDIQRKGLFRWVYYAIPPLLLQFTLTCSALAFVLYRQDLHIWFGTDKIDRIFGAAVMAFGLWRSREILRLHSEGQAKPS